MRSPSHCGWAKPSSGLGRSFAVIGRSSDALTAIVAADPRGGTTGDGGRGGGAGMSGPCGSVTCSAAQFCDWSSNRCPQNDSTMTCQARPAGCTDLFDPVCGCDGQVYGNACEANAAGQDVADRGGCTPPSGKFPCGHRFCTRGSQYCEAMLGGAVINPGAYACHPLPAGCGATPSCACLVGSASCAQCQMSASGDLMTSCLFP